MARYVSVADARWPSSGPTSAGLQWTPANGGNSGDPTRGVISRPGSGSGLGLVSEHREIPILDRVDVLVCGGGPAGTAAAIGAARHGARTLLLERYGFLGGMATAGLVVPHWDPRQNAGVNLEFIAELEKRGAWGADLYRNSFDPEIWKHVSDQLVLDAGADVLYHTLIVGALRDGDRVDGVVVETKSGRFAILSDVVVDATGDADVAAHAGAEYRVGRDEDGLMQPMTTMFRLGGVDWVQHRGEELFELVNAAVHETGSDFRLAYEWPWAIHMPNAGEVGMMLTHIYQVDGTDVRDLTRAEIEARRQAAATADFLRENVAEFASSYLIDTAPQVGIRETRRVVGDYTLTTDDVVNGRAFSDVITTVSFAMDIHHPDDGGTTALRVGASGAGQRGVYDIPYRSLVVKGLEQLLVAGRCISGSHEAHASYRVKGPCMAIGQAAGVAAAIASEDLMTVRSIDVDRLQGALRAQGVVLPTGRAESIYTDDFEVGFVRDRDTPRLLSGFRGPG